MSRIDGSGYITDLLDQVKQTTYGDGKSMTRAEEAYQGLLYYLDPKNSAAAGRGDNQFLDRPRVSPDVENVIIKLSTGRVTLNDAERAIATKYF